MAAYPHRFHTADQLTQAAWPDCLCGHPAKLHGLLVQHVGGSGCFKTFWKDSAGGGYGPLRVFAGACDCEDYRPETPLTEDQIAAAPIRPLVAG